jgi:hypothetical protein
MPSALCVHVLGHRLIHTDRRNALGGGVEVVDAFEAGEVGGAGGFSEHGGKDERMRRFGNLPTPLTPALSPNKRQMKRISRRGEGEILVPLAPLGERVRVRGGVG